MIRECPNHEGNFDCTPFCRICEGEQEYNMPEKINVMKVVTYDVKQIAESICELDSSMSMDTITIADVIDYVQGWVEEDFGTQDTLIWQDENGVEL